MSRRHRSFSSVHSSNSSISSHEAPFQSRYRGERLASARPRRELALRQTNVWQMKWTYAGVVYRHYRRLTAIICRVWLFFASEMLDQQHTICLPGKLHGNVVDVVSLTTTSVVLRQYDTCDNISALYGQRDYSTIKNKRGVPCYVLFVLLKDHSPGAELHHRANKRPTFRFLHSKAR